MPNQYKLTFKRGLQCFEAIIAAFTSDDALSQFVQWRKHNNIEDYQFIGICPFMSDDLELVSSKLIEDSPFALVVRAVS